MPVPLWLPDVRMPTGGPVGAGVVLIVFLMGMVAGGAVASSLCLYLEARSDDAAEAARYERRLNDYNESEQP